MSKASPEFISGREGKLTWGRKDEEYIADFCLVSRKALDDFEYKVFKYHFLLGADWKLCTRRLKIDRGTFFHSVYRIEQRLGRVFRELEPYALYPLDEYFRGARRPPEHQRAVPLGIDRKAMMIAAPIRPPLLERFA